MRTSTRILLLLLPCFGFSTCADDTGRHDPSTTGAKGAQASAPEQKPTTTSGHTDQGPSTPTTDVTPDKNEKPGPTPPTQGPVPPDPEAAIRAAEELAKKERRWQTWISPPAFDLGEQRVGTVASAKFSIRNPTKTDRVLRNITSSCKCQSIQIRLGGKVYDIQPTGHEPIPIAAGAQGSIHVEIKVPNDKGRVINEVRIETTDPSLPAVRIGVFVNPIRVFVIETGGVAKSAIDFGELDANDVRDYEFIARTRDGTPFEILEHNPLPPAMKLSFRPTTTAKNVWRIAGSIGPGLSRMGFSGMVVMKTNRDEDIDLHVYCAVRPPIRLDPGSSIAFGQIARQKGATRELRLRPSKAGQDMRIARAEVFGLPEGLLAAGSEIGLDIENADDGKASSIRITLPKGMQTGSFTCGLRVHFEGETFEPEDVRILGVVR